MDLDKTLWLAIKSGKDQLVYDLLQKGADVEYVGDNFLQEKPIHLAATIGSLNIMKILLQFKANVDTVTRFKKTSLHIACEKGSFEIIKLLLENGSDPEAKQYGNLKTPLHIACEIGSMDLVQLLFGYGVGVDPETASSRFFDLDKTPLHYACRRGHLHIVKLLVSKNANVFSLSHDNLSSIQIAEKQGHSNISTFLLSVINNGNVKEEFLSNSLSQSFSQMNFTGQSTDNNENQKRFQDLEMKLQKSESQIISLQQKLWESFKIISQINNPNSNSQVQSLLSELSINNANLQNLSTNNNNNNNFNNNNNNSNNPNNNVNNNVNNVNNPNVLNTNPNYGSNNNNNDLVLSNEHLTNPVILKLNEELLKVSKFAEQHSKVNQMLHMKLYEQQILCRASIVDFRILAQISANDDYNIYRVKCTKLGGREYTFKVLKDVNKNDGSFFRYRFYNELKTYNALSPHANILTIFSNTFSNFTILLQQQNENENTPKIFEIRIDKPNILSHHVIFEKEQITLKEYIKTWKGEKPVMMKLICDLTAGIAHLYKNGIAHTAIKAENINVKIENNVFSFQLMNMEFSVSSPDFTVPFDPVFHQAQVEENLINLPPEVLFAIQSKQNVNYEKCDVFSFGCMIFELFLGYNIFEKIDKRDYYPSSHLSTVVPYCKNLNKLLLNTIDPNPNSRYSPKKLLELLSSVVNISQHNFKN